MQYQYQRAQIAEEAFNVHAETGLSPRQLAEQRAELLEALKDAVIQIEYLHRKFEETGSGNIVLSRSRAAIANSERKG